VKVRPLADGDPASPLEVVGVVPGSPAAAFLRRGDVLLGLARAPRLRNAAFLLESALLDQISSLDAGARAELRVRRGGSVISVALTLGSLADPSVAGAPVATYPASVL
jgi:S1-C subfamily serine protease